MAEVLGVVASGIAIGQATAAITSSLLKLNELRNQIKCIPVELEHQLKEIEVLNLMAIEIESQEQQSSCGTVSVVQEQALQLLKDAARELETFITELNDRIRSKWGMRKKVAIARVVMEKDEIKRHKSRLKRCCRLLALVQNLKTHAMLERQAFVLKAQVVQKSKHLIAGVDENDDQHDASADVRLKSTKSRKVSASKSPPNWQIKIQLLSRQWHLVSRRAQSGWDFGFRMFVVVPGTSPLTALVWNDNVGALQELIRDGLASPFTIIEYSGTIRLTLLAWAVMFGSLSAAELLHNEGADAMDDSLDRYENALWWLTLATTFNVGEQQPNKNLAMHRVRSLATMILPKSNDDLEEDLLCLENFRGRLPLFQQIQLSLYPSYPQCSLATKAGVAKEIIRSPLNSPDVFWAALGDDFLETAICHEPDNTDFSHTAELFRLVVVRFAHSLFEERTIPENDELYAPLYETAFEGQNRAAISTTNMADYPLCGWQAAIHHFFNQESEIPERLFDNGTSLWVILAPYVLPHPWDDFAADGLCPRIYTAQLVKYPERASQALHSWLEMLLDLGVNLEEYGRGEVEISKWQEVKDIVVFSQTGRGYLSLDASPDTFLRIISLDVGPRLGDWKYWLSEPTDPFAGDFWDMIEHPERTMPGAWDDFAW